MLVSCSRALGPRRGIRVGRNLKVLPSSFCLCDQPGRISERRKALSCPVLVLGGCMCYSMIEV